LTITGDLFYYRIKLLTAIQENMHGPECLRFQVAGERLLDGPRMCETPLRDYMRVANVQVIWI